MCRDFGSCVKVRPLHLLFNILKETGGQFIDLITGELPPKCPDDEIFSGEFLDRLRVRGSQEFRRADQVFV